MSDKHKGFSRGPNYKFVEAKCITEAKSKSMIDKMNASREIENRKIDGNMSNDDFRDLWGEL